MLKNIILVLILLIIIYLPINDIHKPLIYFILIMNIIYNYYKNIETFTDLKKSNIYPFKSYENLNKLTYDFYKKGYKKILSNKHSNVDLELHGWPSNFNEQTQNYLDKIRYVKTDKPLPTNADFFIK